MAASLIPDGATVSYIGPERDGLVVGDEGTVLMNTGSTSHVLMRTGASSTQVPLLDNRDLVLGRLQSDSVWDQAIDATRITHFGAREVFEARGPVGVLSALHAEGHLATMEPIITEAITSVANRVRQDPALREIAVQLDDDDTEAVIGRVSMYLLKQAVAWCP